MKMSQRYDEEQQQRKKEIEELQRQCDKEDDQAFCKEQFLRAVRKFKEQPKSRSIGADAPIEIAKEQPFDCSFT